MYRPEKSPAVVLRQFKQSTPAKTEADFLVGDEIEKALRYFQQMREEISLRHYMRRCIYDCFTYWSTSRRNSWAKKKGLEPKDR